MRDEPVFYKNKPEDSIWWLDSRAIGEFEFSFDKKKIYNLFRDYPDKLSVEEWEAFNKENPYWEQFFKKRNEEYKRENLDGGGDSTDAVEKFRERRQARLDNKSVNEHRESGAF